MTQNSGIKLTASQVRIYSYLFGFKPVLTSEIGEEYDDMMFRLVEDFGPINFFELMLIRRALDEIWKYLRYMRHQTLGIERRCRDSLEFQTLRGDRQKENLDQAIKARAAATPSTDLEKLDALEEKVVATVPEVENLLMFTPEELAHNRALEAGIVFHERLDHLASAALARHNDAIEQLSHYRRHLGVYTQRFSQRLLDAAKRLRKEEADRPKLEDLEDINW